MDLRHHSSLSGRPAVLSSKNFNVGHYTQTFQFVLCLPYLQAPLISTIFSLTLTLAGVTMSELKTKPVVFIFSHPFQLINMTLDLMLKQFKLNILILLLSEI